MELGTSQVGLFLLLLALASPLLVAVGALLGEGGILNRSKPGSGGQAPLEPSYEPAWRYCPRCGCDLEGRWRECPDCRE